VLHSTLNSGTKDRVCVLLRNSLLTRFGKYSYCIYVVHMLVGYFLVRAERTASVKLGATYFSRPKSRWAQ
jgi:peptidoglycan/LPS O-acetylase OafA/YrhL